MALGIFDLTLAIKLVPNKHVYFYLPFILPTLLNHVDVTLAYDDDHQIPAHKTAITGLRMEFLVHGLGFILEDSASLICSDEKRNKGTKRQKN